MISLRSLCFAKCFLSSRRNLVVKFEIILWRPTPANHFTWICGALCSQKYMFIQIVWLESKLATYLHFIPYEANCMCEKLR